MTIAARSTGAANATVPDRADDYRRCIATKRKALPPKQRQKVTDTRLRTQCDREYAQLRDQVMQLLISFEWIDGEAALRGLTVTEAEVTQAFDKQKRQSFPKESDFQEFLKTSGQTVADIYQRVRLDLLSNKLRDQVVAGHGQITDQAVEQYYRRHRSSFVEPETRSLRIVLTERKAEAERALAELRARRVLEVGGPAVLDRQGDQAQGRQTAALGGGRAGELVREGRLPRPQGAPGRPAPHRVRLLRPDGHQDRAGTPAVTDRSPGDDPADARIGGPADGARRLRQDFTVRWRAKTECAEGYRTSDCRNGPAPSPRPSGTGTAEPEPAVASSIAVIGVIAVAAGGVGAEAALSGPDRPAADARAEASQRPPARPAGAPADAAEHFGHSSGLTQHRSMPTTGLGSLRGSRNRIPISTPPRSGC